jgi:hypothetical protein
MPSAVVFMQWESYVGDGATPPFFHAEPLTFNSRQDRLHRLQPGDRLWLVSRCPTNQQYCFLASLSISTLVRNPPGSALSQAFGEFAIVAKRSVSHDFGTSFPAEGFLRAFTFEPEKPIKYGASIGQSLQTIRFLNPADELVLQAALTDHLRDDNSSVDALVGLWTKCDIVFAQYFLNNWKARKQPLAFLLYDPPPMLSPGAPIFIHSDKDLRLLARFSSSQFVAGHKLTVEAEERRLERERIWREYRLGTIDQPAKEQFDTFWESQHGVRGLFVMDEVTSISHPPAFKAYGRALEWGYPMGVGYRYLSRSQSYLLLRQAGLTEEGLQKYLPGLIHQAAPAQGDAGDR